MPPFRTVVVGYGFAGRSFHCHLVKRARDLALHGVVARDPAKRQQAEAEQGCRSYAEMDAALDDPVVDLVVLATPHDTHAPLAIRALRAGKHVVTDKVMCLDLAEADAMIAAARDAKRLLTVFHNRRWDGDYLTLKRTIDDGLLGDVRWIEMSWNRPGVPSRERWRGRPEAGGGKLYDLGAHLLDQLLLLFPARVTGVYCRMHRDFPGADVESHAIATLSFADGRTAIADVNAMTCVPKPRIHAVGDVATFVKHGTDPQEPAMLAGDIDAAREPEALYARVVSKEGEQTIATLPGRWRSFYENVADTLAGHAEPAVKLEEMRRLMAVLDAARESASTGQVITPADTGPAPARRI